MTFLRSPESNFPRRIDGFEIAINGFFSGKCIGYADLCIRKSQVSYYVEIKLNKNIDSGDIWGAIKILGYVAAEKMITPYRNIKSCIMVRKEIVTNDFIAISGSLGISYITVDLRGGLPQFECFL